MWEWILWGAGLIVLCVLLYVGVPILLYWLVWGRKNRY